MNLTTVEERSRTFQIVRGCYESLGYCLLDFIYSYQTA